MGISVDKKPSHEAAGINEDWPAGRGVFVDDSHAFLLLVNFEDHIQIIATSENGDIGSCLRSLSKVTAKFEKLGFANDPVLGYLTTNPANLGTGLDLNAQVYTHTNVSEHCRGILKTSYACKTEKIGKRHYSVTYN